MDFGRMAGEGDYHRVGGLGSSGLGDDDRSWARVVQGLSHGSSWTSHRIINEEIDQLQSYFSKVLKLFKAMLSDSRVVGELGFVCGESGTKSFDEVGH